MPLVYDLHLAACTISSGAIDAIEELGFERDRFTNVVGCPPCVYHATYRGGRRLPDDQLWQGIQQILESDEHFSGALEEELVDPSHRRLIEGRGESMPPRLPALPVRGAIRGVHKECDLHIRINVGLSDPATLGHLEGLGFASVDRVTPEGTFRLFTVTCESAIDGFQLLQVLGEYLSSIPRLQSKLKLETTSRQLCVPDDVSVLPMIISEGFRSWLAGLERPQILSKS